MGEGKIRVGEPYEEPTLRDQFAMAALGGMTSITSVISMDSELIAKKAWAVADAMLKERNK